MYELGTPAALPITDQGHEQGALYRLHSGRLLYVYNSSPMGHQSNLSSIRLRYSDDNGVTWSAIIAVAEDASYDDRNHTQLQVTSGRFFVYYQRYDASTSTRIDSNYVYSDDIDTASPTFSARVKMWDGTGVYGLPSPAGGFIIDSAFGVPFYYHSGATPGCYIGTTTNGIDFTWEKSADASYVPGGLTGEPSYAQYESGNVLAVYRSYEGDVLTNMRVGGSWSTPSAVTFSGAAAPGSGGGAPYLFHDRGADVVYLLCCDRDVTTGSANMLTIWRHSSGTVFEYVNGCVRPDASAYFAYGYPSAVAAGSGALIAFTERSGSGTTELAWPYEVALALPFGAWADARQSSIAVGHAGGIPNFTIERRWL